MGLNDVFRRFNEPGVSPGGTTSGDFHQGPECASTSSWSATTWPAGFGCVQDRDARKGQKPSDHAPVIVDFADA